MSDQNNRSSGFTLGLVFGLLAGFVIAVLLYKRNPKVFSQVADKLNSLIKDIASGSANKAPSQEKVSPPPPKTIAASRPTPIRRPHRPKTFVRPRP